MTDKLFEAALGVSPPWQVTGADFDLAAKTLTIRVDFIAGSRFALAGVEGQHPVHDTVAKRYRHLNFFQHECFLEVRVPRVKLPDGSVRQVDPPWAGKLSGFTLLFEALVLLLCQQMTFAAAARLVGVSRHRVAALCERYVELALAQTDLSAVRELAIDETSRARGHDYITLAADATERRVIAVAEGRGADSIAQLTTELQSRHCPAEQITSVSIDMSPAFIRGCAEHLPNARVTFDKFHVIGHANAAVDRMRRIEQRSDKSLKGMRWSLLKNRASLKPEAAADLDALIARMATVRTARAWVYKEQLREILARKQINVARDMLKHWCTCVMRSKVEPMKEVAAMVRRHLEGIVAWAQTRQTNGFLEALNGLFQSAKRRARGFTRFTTIRTVIFLIAGKLDFAVINP
ncbi:ISL3 family transposase, partial [Pseudomonas aeruginosa]|nr:ISL3 family transposase [Pseudomonas aeruginosa]